MKKLIGSTVVHRVWGKGTVYALTDKIITVKFSNCEKGFTYPEAFENFLKSTDEKTQNDILKLIAEEKLKKEREEQRAAELRQLERERIEAAKRQDYRKTNTPKQYERKNAAFKCTYCDGGKTKNCIGFKGMCSKENINVNIESGRNWCSRSACRDYYDGEITRKGLADICKKESLCYECRILLDWKFSVGWTEPKYDKYGEIIKESEPKKINNMMPGSIAVLTTRTPHTAENERIIFAVFLVDDSFDGDSSKEGFVTADSKYKIAFSPNEAEEMLFWDFHCNSSSPEKALWGEGLFRYISDISAANILKRAVEIKRGTKDEKLALEFFEYFCQTHGINSENIPECESALKLKS